MSLPAATAASGSPIPVTATCRGSGPSRRPVTTSTDGIRARGCSPSSPMTSSSRTGSPFSPDESVLYVTDSGANQETGSFYAHLPHHVIAYDVDHGRHLVNRRLFAVTNPGFPDGLKVDADGRVYASSFSGVQVFSPLGDLIGEILLAGAVNFCFGGLAGNVLFITTDDAVWAATLAASAGASLSAEQIRSGRETKELLHDRQPHAPDHR